MLQEKTKVYIYTRVSTTMQIDRYLLDGPFWSARRLHGAAFWA